MPAIFKSLFLDPWQAQYGLRAEFRHAEVESPPETHSGGLSVCAAVHLYRMHGVPIAMWRYGQVCYVAPHSFPSRRRPMTTGELTPET